MNNEYVCKIGNVEDIKKYFDAKIKDNLEDNSYKVYKNHFIQAFEDKTRLFYFGYLNGEIITRAVAIISKEDKYIQNKDGLIDKNKAYLTAFETKKEFQSNGYFKQLYAFVEKDLVSRGFKHLTLGVEPNEVKNISIYFKLGFTNFIKYAFEEYEPENIAQCPEKVLVLYYQKSLD